MSLLDRARQTERSNTADRQFGCKADVPGDGVEGVIVEQFIKESQFRDQQGNVKIETHYVVQEDDGQRVLIWTSRKCVRDELDRAKAGIGVRVGGVYKGPDQAKPGKKPFERYVFVSDVNETGSGPDSAPKAGDRDVPF